jgi:hypothetical protein
MQCAMVRSSHTGHLLTLQLQAARHRWESPDDRAPRKSINGRTHCQINIATTARVLTGDPEHPGIATRRDTRTHTTNPG